MEQAGSVLSGKSGVCLIEMSLRTATDCHHAPTRSKSVCQSHAKAACAAGDDDALAGCVQVNPCKHTNTIREVGTVQEGQRTNEQLSARVGIMSRLFCSREDPRSGACELTKLSF